MEQYIVSARKYRPSTFASVVGQKSLTSTLKNAIATHRLAHSYLFCGSRGVGKTSCARIFAKTINCTNVTADGEACNECDSCRAFNEGSSMNIIELDAASHNGVDDIRDLIDQVQVSPAMGRYRVFIIDEVHMLSSAAFNAFLKTLEEPPSYAIFILATTEKHKIIPTILSRCQIYDFSRITIADMVAHLQYVASQEGIEAEPRALHIIARQADGAMRDALSIFDQVAASSRGHVTYESTAASLNVLDNSYYERLFEAFEKGDIPGALLVFHEVRAKGFDPQFFLGGLGDYLRDLMLACSPATLPLIDAPDDVRASMAALAKRLSPQFFYAAIGLCNDADLNYRTASNKQLLTEVTLIRIAQLLNPSPVKSGQGEGSIKPIERQQAARATGSSAQPAAQPQPQAPQPAPAAPQAAAQPAPAPRPAPQPAPLPAAPKPAGSAHGPAIRIGGMSIHGTAPAAAAQKAARNSQFTPEQVAQAWARFIDANPAEHLLINAMRAATPAQASGATYTLQVASAIQARMIEEAMPRILDHMHASLDNDAFKLEIQVVEVGPTPQYWTERQVLQHITEKYPAFVDLMNDLKLKAL